VIGDHSRLINPSKNRLLPLSNRNDAVVFHADIEALGHVVVALALGAGVGLDLIDAFEGNDRLGRADRFAIATGGAYVTYYLKSHGYSPNFCC
jgi:hypothetical protein